VILGALEEGHAITYLAKDKNVFDTNFLFAEEAAERLSDVKKIYTTNSRIEAIELLDKYNVDYIIVSHKVKEDYQIKNLYFRDEDCLNKVYRGEVEIYKNNCLIRVLAT